MKYVLVTYYDKDLESYSTLQAVQCPSWHDLKTDFVRGLKKQFPVEKLGTFAHRVLICKGTFDDETGEVVRAENKEELDLDLLLAERTDYLKAIEKVGA